MDTTPQLNFTEFQNALTPQRMRPFQIVSLALLAGSTLFFGIILFLYSTTEPAETMPDNSILPLLTMVHLCMAFIHYIAIAFVRLYFMSPKGLKMLLENMNQSEAQTNLSAEVRCVGAIFTGFILKTAILEGMALFGLIVCVVGVMEGQIHSQPVYWCNLFSYIVFAAVTVWTFPTKSRLETIFKERFLQGDFRGVS